MHERTNALIRSRDAVIFGLAKLAESRDDQTGQHLERICHYVKILARDYQDKNGQVCGLDLEIFAETAALHDIGKVAVPDAILLKPGKLTREERREIELHPGIGGDTLMAIKRKWGDDPFLITASQIAYAHHERWDGSGYPFGLAGEHIPLPARIAAVADVYDALRTERPYKKSLSHCQAIGYIKEQAGTQFDPNIVKILMRNEKEFERVADTVPDERDSF
ncbi:HD domain-containing protein [Planctomycetota bacterium]|nr:HD domain-containing protein [Planctomycetota bacterium]